MSTTSVNNSNNQVSNSNNQDPNAAKTRDEIAITSIRNAAEERNKAEVLISTGNMAVSSKNSSNQPSLDGLVDLIYSRIIFYLNNRLEFVKFGRDSLILEFKDIRNLSRTSKLFNEITKIYFTLNKPQVLNELALEARLEKENPLLLHITQNGGVLISGSNDAQIKIWDLVSGTYSYSNYYVGNGNILPHLNPNGNLLPHLNPNGNLLPHLNPNGNLITGSSRDPVSGTSSNHNVRNSNN